MTIRQEPGPLVGPGGAILHDGRYVVAQEQITAACGHVDTATVWVPFPDSLPDMALLPEDEQAWVTEKVREAINAMAATSKCRACTEEPRQ